MKTTLLVPDPFGPSLITASRIWLKRIVVGSGIWLPLYLDYTGGMGHHDSGTRPFTRPELG